MHNEFNFDVLIDALAERVSEKMRTGMGNGGSPQVMPRLLTVRQAAKYLGCSEPSIYHQLKAGKLTAVRRDRRVFLDVNDLDRMIEECKQYSG